jgi:hypothetical protein
MINYKDVEQKALGVIKEFLTMQDKSDADTLLLRLDQLGLAGSVNMYDPQARARGLCQELKTAFLKEGNNLPPLHIDLETSTITDNGDWTVKDLIDQISTSLHRLTKEDDIQ